MLISTTDLNQNQLEQLTEQRTSKPAELTTDEHTDAKRLILTTDLIFTVCSS